MSKKFQLEGVHIFGTGDVPPHSSKNKQYGIELYTKGRFVLLTGNGAQGNVQSASAHMQWLVDSYFPPKEAIVAEEWRYEPVPEWNGPTDDLILVEKLMQKRKFGDGVSVADLMKADEVKLGGKYPAQNDKDPYDRSSADQALASHLAFWTGKNHDRIRNIMFKSALFRGKWIKHKNYLVNTISNAVNSCQNVYGQHREQVPDEDEDGDGDGDDPLAWTSEYEISEAEVEAISDPEWIIQNLVIKGHLSVFPAKPNAGKTTIFFHLSGEMVSKGYDVIYVNADVSGSDAKEYFHKAKKMGTKLLLPDLKVGKSMNDIVDELGNLNDANSNLDNVVFIFDTLKKMTDVISKQHSKKLYMLLRSLTGKEATIILLAHTNKYEGEDGKPMFEGTIDLRADVDEMIYLIPMKNPDGSLTVSTAPDKVRGDFKPITFDISKDREVKLRDEFVDTQSSQKLADRIKEDQPLIDLVNGAIDAGFTTQKSIVDSIKNTSSYGIRMIRRVLNDYSKPVKNHFDVVVKAGQGKFWGIGPGDRNEYIYKKLIIVPDGEDERLFLAPIVFGPENNPYLNSHGSAP